MGQRVHVSGGGREMEEISIHNNVIHSALGVCDYQKM